MDVDVEILDAARPAPAAAVLLDDIGAHFAAVGEEARADLAFGVQLVVVIFGNPAAELEQLERAAEREIGAEVGAGLAAVDGRLLGLFRRIEREADRHAVTEGMMADRDADVGVAVHISDAAGDIADGAGGVRQRALEIGERANVGIGAGQRFLAERLRKDEAADARSSNFE